MSRLTVRALTILFLLFAISGIGVAADHGTLPNPAVDESPAQTSSQQTAVLAGGVFLGNTSRLPTRERRHPRHFGILRRLISDRGLRSREQRRNRAC